MAECLRAMLQPLSTLSAPWLSLGKACEMMGSSAVQFRGLELLEACEADKYVKLLLGTRSEPTWINQRKPSLVGILSKMHQDLMQRVQQPNKVVGSVQIIDVFEMTLLERDIITRRCNWGREE
ncbi:hypothetical protein B0H14DRAFT_2571322 [Mycena olivaceomarginata]|nr:hypothetical protein B0H14DRAFT_2571322 [Mycena olivaceomarginata]